MCWGLMQHVLICSGEHWGEGGYLYIHTVSCIRSCTAEKGLLFECSLPQDGAGHAGGGIADRVWKCGVLMYHVKYCDVQW